MDTTNERKARLAAALRANLRKRKERSRGETASMEVPGVAKLAPPTPK